MVDNLIDDTIESCSSVLISDSSIEPIEDPWVGFVMLCLGRHFSTQGLLSP